MTDYSDIQLSVNSELYTVRVEPRKTLADTLREDCGLTGTHLGCEHGVCGACTVLLDDKPVRACLMFAVQAQGHPIRTVESLAHGDQLNAIQQSFCDHHALQCGFCTSGFLMLITGALEKNPILSDEEIVELVSSNLCRCTGYVNIIKAVQDVRNQNLKMSA
jgi:carbon-monoxide dehydrogenase small subunit